MASVCFAAWVRRRFFQRAGVAGRAPVAGIALSGDCPRMVMLGLVVIATGGLVATVPRRRPRIPRRPRVTFVVFWVVAVLCVVVTPDLYPRRKMMPAST